MTRRRSLRSSVTTDMRALLKVMMRTVAGPYKGLRLDWAEEAATAAWTAVAAGPVTVAACSDCAFPYS